MIYLAGPLFTSAERLFNLKLESAIKKKLCADIFLPQRECAGLSEPGQIFLCCRGGVKESDAVIAVLEGTDADSGTAWEAGYAHGLGKPVIGIRTDFRQAGEDRGLNLMLSCGCDHLIIVNSLDHENPFDVIADMLAPLIARYVYPGKQT